MNETNEENKIKPQNIKFHVPPDLEYVYRDIFNVYAGTGDVVIEFGNHHKSMPEHVSISNRIVMTTGNAYLLIQTLQKALSDAQAALQHKMSNQSK